MDSLPVRGDRISTNGLAKLIEQRYGEAPKMKHLGSLDDLRKRVDDCRRGEVDWIVMRLYAKALLLRPQTLKDRRIVPDRFLSGADRSLSLPTDSTPTTS